MYILDIYFFGHFLAFLLTNVIAVRDVIIFVSPGRATNSKSFMNH